MNRTPCANWVKTAERTRTTPSDVSSAAESELRALRKRVADLELEKDILRKAAAYFATDGLIRSANNPAAQVPIELVTSITGLSVIGAAEILAETGDPTRFATVRALLPSEPGKAATKQTVGVSPTRRYSIAVTGPFAGA